MVIRGQRTEGLHYLIDEDCPKEEGLSIYPFRRTEIKK
jgi:hypothetical protein